MHMKKMMIGLLALATFPLSSLADPCPDLSGTYTKASRDESAFSVPLKISQNIKDGITEYTFTEGASKSGSVILADNLRHTILDSPTYYQAQCLKGSLVVTIAFAEDGAEEQIQVVKLTKINDQLQNSVSGKMEDITIQFTETYSK